MNSIAKHAHPAFSGLELKGKLLCNRLVVAPMSRVSATEDGEPTFLMKQYYAAFASGGFAMVVTEGLYTDNVYSRAYPCQPGLATHVQMQKWKDIVAEVHGNGALIIAQLMHAGGISQHLAETAAPSGLRPPGTKMPEYGGGSGAFPVPKELRVEDIESIIQGYIDSAHRAWQAGFDGIEVHGANGYLLDQFLTPEMNRREDEWGGSVINRTRIIREIIAGIRGIVPQDFIIGLRLSEGKVNDLRYRWPEGASAARQILHQFIATPPDYIHIAAETGRWETDCVYPDGSSFTGIAKSVLHVPVIANGGLHRLDVARTVLEEGHADFIAVGTAALADPSWPVKVSRGIVPIPFQGAFIKPSATIPHTEKVKNALQYATLSGAVI